MKIDPRTINTITSAAGVALGVVQMVAPGLPEPWKTIGAFLAGALTLLGIKPAGTAYRSTIAENLKASPVPGTSDAAELVEKKLV